MSFLPSQMVCLNTSKSAGNGSEVMVESFKMTLSEVPVPESTAPKQGGPGQKKAGLTGDRLEQPIS